MVVLGNGAPMTQISLAIQKVSENLEVWFFRQSSMTEKNSVLLIIHCGQRQIITVWDSSVSQAEM